MSSARLVSIVGLGYVGLPVAVAFGKRAKVVGFDINSRRVAELKEGYDRTGEVDAEDLRAADILFTDSKEDLRQADFHIVAVPTPVDEGHQPDLGPVFKASEIVGGALKKGDIVVYESTVYPGATEEECVPILEKVSGLRCGSDFKVGYSPERINPGDREHTFTKIKKIVSGQDAEALEIVARVYESVVTAGVHRTGSIKAAEAAKVIENTQRDLNIALMNELAMIFDLMGIDTKEVIEAAATKWNFLRFTPGLVGGHCIGVDPYYLTHKAERLGYTPQVILAGRRINDGMGKFIAQRTVKEIIHAGHNVSGSTVTVLGFTFKENIPDIRNTRVNDIVEELREYGINVQVHDPIAHPGEALDEYKIQIAQNMDELKPAEAVIVAVYHQYYRDLHFDGLQKLLKQNAVIVDVKGTLDADSIRKAGIRLWRL